MCVTNSTFSRHLSLIGLFGNRILKRCPFRRKCLIRNPVTHRNWFLFSFYSSLGLLAEGPCTNLFAWLSPVNDSILYCLCLSSPWQSSWKFLLNCHELVQVLWVNIQIPLLPVDRPYHVTRHPYLVNNLSIVGNSRSTRKPVSCFHFPRLVQCCLHLILAIKTT
jgi:hypothetical protein